MVRKRLSNDDPSGGQGAPDLRRYGRELVSKPAISLEKCWEGYRRTTLLFYRMERHAFPVRKSSTPGFSEIFVVAVLEQTIDSLFSYGYDDELM